MKPPYGQTRGRKRERGGKSDRRGVHVKVPGGTLNGSMIVPRTPCRG